MQSSFQKQYIQLNSEMVADVMLKSELVTHRTTTQLLKQVPSKAQGQVPWKSAVQLPSAEASATRPRSHHW